MRNILLVIVLSICVLLTADPLKLTGNIENGENIEEKGCLAQLLEVRGIEAESVLLIGSDGTAALIDKSAFKLINIHYGDPGWSSVTTSLPPVCNIKDLSAIAIWKTSWKIHLIIDTGSNYPKYYTPFNWIIKDFNFIATSSRNGYQVEKYRHEAGSEIISGEVTVFFADDKELTTIFESEKFTFNGYEFMYNNKPIIKIYKEGL